MPRGEETGLAGGRAVLALVACLIGFAIAAGNAHAYQPTGSDFRVSNVFTDGDATRVGTDSAIAYNSTANEYLVVYRADAGASDDDFEIFGRRVSTAGIPQGTDFPISNMAGTDRTAQAPAVAYNSVTNQYMVVWSGDGLATNDEFEIFGHRVSAAGTPAAGPDLRLSEVGPVDDATRDAEEPAIAYNPVDNEHLVSWQADDPDTEPLVDDKLEIFGRLVTGAGAPSGNDFRLSNGGPDSDQTFDATLSEVAFNPSDGEYLVVWQGEGLATEGVTETWGQRVTAAGVPSPQGDKRFSNQGSDTDATRDGGMPAVAYNSSANAYLVVWRDDGFVGADNDEFEVFGQRVSATAVEQAGDFRLSTVGTDGDASRAADAPAVAFSSAANEYLVAWDADGLAAGGELEVFSQRVNATGGQVGGDTRVSSAGTDGDPTRDAEDPSLAFASVPNQFLATYTADDLGTEDEFEIFGQRLTPAPVTAAPPPQRAYPLPKKKCKKKKKKKQKGKSLAAASKKKKKKKKC